MPRARDWTAFASVLTEIGGHLRAARSEGSTIDPWAIAGIGRKEVQNAAVLARLWTQAIGGDIAVDFLDAYLRRIEERSGVALPSRAQLDAGYHVDVENCPLGAASERVDITVECAGFMIGIEVKIDSGLGPAQLERYTHAIATRARLAGKVPVVLFLAPYPVDAPAVVPTTWSDVAAAGRSLSPPRSERSFNIQLIERFAAHVARFERRKR